MTITAELIREAVDRGWDVHWSHEGYVVEKWQATPQHPDGQYAITCVHNNHSIGLYYEDRETGEEILNGKPEDFFANVQADQLERYQDHRGSWHVNCPQCRMMIVLFDDDTHCCTLEDWRNA